MTMGWVNEPNCEASTMYTNRTERSNEMNNERNDSLNC